MNVAIEQYKLKELGYKDDILSKLYDSLLVKNSKNGSKMLIQRANLVGALARIWYATKLGTEDHPDFLATDESLIRQLVFYYSRAFHCVAARLV